MDQALIDAIAAEMEDGQILEFIEAVRRARTTPGLEIRLNELADAFEGVLEIRLENAMVAEAEAWDLDPYVPTEEEAR